MPEATCTTHTPQSLDFASRSEATLSFPFEEGGELPASSTGDGRPMSVPFSAAADSGYVGTVVKSNRGIRVQNSADSLARRERSVCWSPSNSLERRASVAESRYPAYTS